MSTYKSRPFSPPRAIPAAPPAIAAAAVSSHPRSRSPPADHFPSFYRPQCISQGRLLSKPAPHSPCPPSCRGTHRRPPSIPLTGRPFRPNSDPPTPLGEPLAEPSRLPGRERRRLTEIWLEPRRLPGQGPNCSVPDLISVSCVNFRTCS
jgi:hypothetical protein